MEEKRPYHHKNLRQALLDACIAIVNEEGAANLSLRRVAARCGVSHAAPYSHFQSKEDMISACRDFVTEELTEHLLQAVSGRALSDPATLNVIGLAYVGYFQVHPAYFHFLFSRAEGCRVELTLKEREGNFPPFEVFRAACVALTKRYRLSEETGRNKLVQCWSLVQGAASLITSKNISLDGDWNKFLQDVFA